MENFFKLKEHGTTVSTEVVAGITTFFAMSYIIFVNPAILSLSGMPSQAVFLATIISAAVSTLVMGLFANVPYALAPGMGLERLLHFHCRLLTWFHLARSFGHGIHLWDGQRSDHSYQNQKNDHQIDP